jgi:hypothetical protein
MTNPTEHPTPGTPHDTIRDTLVRVRTWLAQTGHVHWRSGQTDDCARCLVPEIDAALAAPRHTPHDTITTPDFSDLDQTTATAPDTITTADQLDALIADGRREVAEDRRIARKMRQAHSRESLVRRALVTERLCDALDARGSADVETLRDLIAERADLLASNKTLRAAVERLRETVTRLSEQHQAARHVRDQWKTEAMRLHRDRNAARTEAATLRTAIEGFRARLVDPARLATEGSSVGVVWALDKIDRILAATPAPEAAPPTLTVTRWKHTLWCVSHDPVPGPAILRADQDHGAHALSAACAVCGESLVPATFSPVGVTVVDAEADR